MASIIGVLTFSATVVGVLYGIKRSLGAMDSDEKKKIGIYDNVELDKTAKEKGIPVNELILQRTKNYVKNKNLTKEQNLKLEKEFTITKKTLEKEIKEIEKKLEEEKDDIKKEELQKELKEKQKQMQYTKDMLEQVTPKRSIFKRGLRKLGLISNNINTLDLLKVFPGNDIIDLPIYTSSDRKTYIISTDMQKNIILMKKISNTKIFGSVLKIKNIIIYLDHNGEYLYFLKEGNSVLLENSPNIKLEEKCDKILNISENIIILKSISGILYILNIEMLRNNIFDDNNQNNITISKMIPKPIFISTRSIVKDIRIMMNKIIYLDYRGKLWISNELINNHNIKFIKMDLPNNVKISIFCYIDKSYKNVRHLMCLDNKGYLYALGTNLKGEIGISNIKKETTKWIKINTIIDPIIKVFIYKNGSIALSSKGDIYHFGSPFNDEILEYREHKDLYIPSKLMHLQQTELLLILPDIILFKKYGSKIKIINETSKDYLLYDLQYNINNNNGTNNNSNIDDEYTILIEKENDNYTDIKLPELNKHLKIK